MSDMDDVIILGAGISGLSAAHMLAAKGERVTILDGYDWVGGNHISRTIGDYTFDIGSIVFWDDNPQFDMFEGLMASCVPISFDVQKIGPSGRITRYPFSLKDEILTLNRRDQISVAASLLKSRLCDRAPASAADFARARIGEELYEKTGLRTYLDRFYGISGEDVSVAFAQRRMTWLVKHSSPSFWAARSLRAAASTLSGRRRPPLKAFARPRKGFDVYYGIIADALRRTSVDIQLSCLIESISRDGDDSVVQTRDRVFRAKRVISTMPVTMTAKWASVPVPGDLPGLSLITLFCSFAGAPSFSAPVLYNFHDSGLWKRLTMHSAFYGLAGDRHYFSVECTQLAQQHTPEDLFADFRRHVSALGIFDGDLQLHGSLLLDNAYPVYRRNFEDVLDPVLEDLNRRGIQPLGRQGRFDYIPSTTEAIELVREALGA